MKEMLKLGFVLASFALVACVALALVNSFTLPLIEGPKAKETAAKMKQVFPQATAFEALDEEFETGSSVHIDSFTLAKDGDNVIGAVIQASGPTYESAVILVGIDKNGSITGTSFVELSDSPGFGQRAKDNGYMDQYTGKTWSDAFEVNQDVEAISGASFSSKGIANIIKTASATAKDYFSGAN